MTARTRAFLGIDLGSTRVKAGLVTPDGEEIATARASYAMDVDPSSGRAEQHAEAWWAGVGRVIREVLADGSIDILAIAVTGHGPTAVPVDADGRPTRPAITWLDTRSTVERDELQGATGLLGWSLGVLPAALWLQRHEPDDRSTRWILNSWEAITLRLTGLAATTLVPGQPFPEMALLAATGLDTDRIAPTCPTGSVVGGLRPDVASALGLVAGTPVVGGLVDAFASFHGAGMVDPGDAIDVGGAAGGFGAYWDRPVEAEGSFTTPAPLAGLWSVGGAMAATGSALTWLANDVLGGQTSIEALIGEAAGISPGADGLVFLPYLAGERSPLWDPAARGVLAGLTLAHGRAHLTRAVLEAAALAIRHVAEPILAAGVDVAAMRVCGGPAHSRTWNQIKADVTGFDVIVPRVLETTVVGAAIVAGVGVGAHASVPAAIRSMTSAERRLVPDPTNRAIYDRLYDRYVGLYPAVAPFVRKDAGASAAGARAVVVGAAS